MDADLGAAREPTAPSSGASACGDRETVNPVPEQNLKRRLHSNEREDRAAAIDVGSRGLLSLALAGTHRGLRSRG